MEWCAGAHEAGKVEELLHCFPVRAAVQGGRPEAVQDNLIDRGTIQPIGARFYFIGGKSVPDMPCIASIIRTT